MGDTVNDTLYTETIISNSICNGPSIRTVFHGSLDKCRPKRWWKTVGRVAPIIIQVIAEEESAAESGKDEVNRPNKLSGFLGLGILQHVIFDGSGGW